MVGSVFSAFSITVAAEFRWAPLTWMVVTEPPRAASAG